MTKLLLLLTSFHVWNCNSQDCDVLFKTNVFTYSKSQERPLRIKMRHPPVGHPCNLSVTLPDNQTVTFLVNKTGRPVLTASPPLLKQSLNLTRKRSDLLWLDVNSFGEAPSKSGIYNISGEKIFAFQTPSKEETVLSQTENITCKGNLDLINKVSFKSPLVGEAAETILVLGQVKLTKMFSLCTQYNALYNVSQHLKHAIDNVTVGQQYLQFVISANESFNEDIEVECNVDGGDGIKEYKIKFKPNLSQCEKTIEPIDSTDIMPIAAPIITVLLIVTPIVIFYCYKRRSGSEGRAAVRFVDGGGESPQAGVLIEPQNEGQELPPLLAS